MCFLCFRIVTVTKRSSVISFIVIFFYPNISNPHFIYYSSYYSPLAKTVRFTESFALTVVSSHVCSAVCVEFKNCRESPSRWRRDYAPPAHTNDVQTHRVRARLKGKCDFECRVSEKSHYC